MLADSQVYRVLLPIYEAKYDYALLEQSHKALADVFRQVRLWSHRP
jgi:hypothetical protein